MKNQTISKLLFYVACALLISSCADDLVLEGPLDTPIDFPDPVLLTPSSLLGSVDDEVGLPIAEALVTCLNCLPQVETRTDDKGDFSFRDIELRGGSALLSVTSPGKFDGFRRMGVVAERTNYTRIQLREKAMLGTVSAADGGTLTHGSGAVITLPVDGIVNDAGQVHAEDYQVFMSWIDPTSPDLNMTMMGDLSAIDAEGELVGLSTFGMLQVELEAGDGTPLNLREGTTAALEFPLPDALRSTAPATIPLWSYNEEDGYWVEEGSASLQGDRYVGEVSHFSTWNVDVKIDPVDLCGSINIIARDQVTNQDVELDLPYFQVRLSGETFQGVGGWLCEDGSFRFINVPSGQALTLEILDYCGELVETIERGPFETGKVELEPISLAAPSDFTFVEATGSAIDCDNNPLTEGLVVLTLAFDVFTFPLNSDGSFSVALPVCGDFEGTVQVINTVDLTASIELAISDQTQDYNLGTLKACDEKPEEFVYIKYDSSVPDGSFEEFFLNPLAVNYMLDSTQSYTIQAADSLFGFFAVNFQDVPMTGVELEAQFVAFISVSPNLIINVEGITINFTDVGPEMANGLFEYLEGSFEGEDVNDNHVIGTFRVKPE